jgi:hypothetical protein
VYGTSDFESGWGYVRHREIVGDDGSTVVPLRAERKPVFDKDGVDSGDLMSQKSVRQALPIGEETAL